MALTAARTELNVSLVGEDETIRMLEDAKKRMADLEAKTRSLTGATKAQTDAARTQQAATAGVNDRLKGLAERAEGVVGGVDKVKGAFEKVVGVAGFLGMAIQGVVSAASFLTSAFDDSEEKAAALEAQMKRNKAETDRLKASTDALTVSMAQMQAATGQAAGVLASERAVLAEMRGDVELAEMERVGAAVEQRKLKAIELTTKETEAEKQRMTAVKEMTETQARIQGLETRRQQLLRDAAKAESQALSAFNKTELKDRAALLRAEAGTLGVNVGLERSRLDLAKRNRDAMDEGVQALREQQKVNKEIIDQQLINLGKPKAEDKSSGGGGGGGRDGAAGPTPEEIAAQLKAEEEQRLRLRDLAQEFRLDELDEEKKHQRRMALAGLGDENLATLRSTRDRVAAELASLPQGAMAAAFAPLKTELEKRLAELDALAKQHAQMGIGEYFDQDQADKVLSSWEAEQKAIEQVNAALSALGETRAKAIEESEKMREAMFRAMPAEVVQAFAVGLERLGEMQAPVFEVVQESLAGLTAQMGKFKEGQTSLTSAIVGSASAIAGAVAKKVLGVKEEAAVRALFETAMGIATAFTNPAESVGHFAAAAAFGLLAGGKVASSDARASSGQKAPAKPAAQSRESTMGGGGGQITNVYNLQTGIVDGQSTAHAFRRAEMTARNTGMASAGGW
jgi:hypothetical protein